MSPAKKKASATSAPPRFFKTAAAFRAWLARHAATADELLVGFYKVQSGKPSLTWPESVDEALCFGWIDGVRTRIDDHAYQIRFTPRRKGSIWSAINLAKVEQLIAAGRMQPAGLAAYALRDQDKSRIYPYEQKDVADLASAELRLFRFNKPAWAYFQECPPGYRKTVTHWVTTAKQPVTRERRLQQLIAACEKRTRLR